MTDLQIYKISTTDLNDIESHGVHVFDSINKLNEYLDDINRLKSEDLIKGYTCERIPIYKIVNCNVKELIENMSIGDFAKLLRAIMGGYYQ